MSGRCRSAARKPVWLGLAVKGPRRAAGVTTGDVGVAVGRTGFFVLELVVEASPVHPLEDLKPLGLTDDGPPTSNARPYFATHARHDALQPPAHAADRELGWANDRALSVAVSIYDRAHATAG
jgi:hypothetical protein